MTTYSDALRELAEPRPVGDTIGAAIRRACRAVGLPPSRTFNIWYQRARRIEAHEAEAITEALRQKLELETSNVIQDLQRRILMVESRSRASATDVGRISLSLTRPRMR